LLQLRFSDNVVLSYFIGLKNMMYWD